MPKFHCDVCSSDATRRVRIRCAVCTDYDLCVPCFAKGATSGTHQPWHDYRIIEQHHYPIFTSDWGADEELLLIEGCQREGLGNWMDIAEYLQTGRTKEEVGKHYENIYINSEYYPIPDLNKTFENVGVGEFLLERKQRMEKRRKIPLPGPKKILTSQPLCSDIQKYMPGRLEFEEEAEDEAEKIVQDMVFDENDSEEDVRIKLLILEIYNEKLHLRAERKRLMLNDGLIDYKTNNAIDKKRTKEEKELFIKIKPFARVMNAQDWADFSNDIMEEFRLRNRINQLQNWRRQGITTLDEGDKYEKDLANRQTKYLSRERHTQTSSRHRPDKKWELPDLLSDEERNLCQSIGLDSRTYFTIKETMLHNIISGGGQNGLEKAVKDSNKREKLWKFFQEQKWVKV
ncbi:chromatin-binding transcription regulator [Martiniozyma asiatica (nom. inval.)]|nr:chromatin-binding transcription regulator [Martiniozyma asiatica]